MIDSTARSGWLRLRTMLAILGLAGLAFLVGHADPATTEVVSLYILLVILAAGVTFVTYRRTNDWFTPSILYSWAWAFYSLRTLQIITDWQSGYIDGRHELHPLLVQSLLLVVLSVASFHVAFLRTSAGAGIRVKGPLRPTTDIYKRLLPVVVGLALVGLVAAIALFGMRGGVTAYLNTLASRRATLTGNQFLLVLAQGLPASALILFVVGVPKTSRTARFVSVGYAVVTVFIVLLLGSRTQALTWAIAFLVARPIVSRGHGRVKRIAATILVIFVLIAVSITFAAARSATLQGDFTATTGEIGSPLDIIADEARGRERSDRFVRVLQVVPDQVEFTYFSTYTRVVTTFIPRRLWPQKPPLSESSEYAAAAFGWMDRSYSTLPGGIIADYYLQLGALGVLILSFANGDVMGRLYQRYREGSKRWIGVYCVALPSIGLGLNNLQIMAFLTRLPMVLVPLVLIVGVGRERGNGPREREGSTWRASEQSGAR